MTPFEYSPRSTRSLYKLGFRFGERSPILDGNVKRVLARHFGIEGDPSQAAIEHQLWTQAAQLLPARAAEMPAYTQAVMDLGATVCTRASPDCAGCPLSATCLALRDGRVDELPTPRARKAMPLRHAQFLVALHDSAALLEQRPPAGLWGGLLSLPQFASLDGLQGALQALRPAASRAALLPMQPHRHAFTHFTLESLALPAPLRTLLCELHVGMRNRQALGKSWR